MGPPVEDAEDVIMYVHFDKSPVPWAPAGPWEPLKPRGPLGPLSRLTL